jgi:hypothetical protein
VTEKVADLAGDVKDKIMGGAQEAEEAVANASEDITEEFPAAVDAASEDADKA